MPNPDRAKPRSMSSLPSFLCGSSSRNGDAAAQASEDGSPPTGQQLSSGQDTTSLPPLSPLLVHRYRNSWGKRVAISIDQTANQIHFENCFRCRWAFKFLPEEHFYGSISDVKSYYSDYDQEHDRYWIILKTPTGTARVLFEPESHSEEEDDSDHSAYFDFYNAIHHVFAFKERRFHTGSFWAMTLYLLSAIVSFVLSQQLIMDRTSVGLPTSLVILLVLLPGVATYLIVDFLDRR